MYDHSMTTGRPKGRRGVGGKVKKINGEWLKAVDSKSTVPLWYRGFESLPLRHQWPILWRGARAVESARLESAWAPKVSRGFESHPLRSSCCACWCRGQRMVVLGGEVA